MTEKKQHNVGERFEQCKIIYEVRESIFCHNCSLFIDEEDHCSDDPANIFESCSHFDRKDHKDVIFVRVGEVND